MKMIAAPGFYSAYVWVVIAICRFPEDLSSSDNVLPANHLLHAVGQADLWRGLIPFFQHGNVAEPSVYNDIKDELASKTVDTMLRELERACTAGSWLHFAFVAAFDDNGDSNQSQTVSEFPGTTIREMMKAKLTDRRSPFAHRIHLESNAVPQLTACDLAMVVRGYLDSIDMETIGKIPGKGHDQ